VRSRVWIDVPVTASFPAPVIVPATTELSPLKVNVLPLAMEIVLPAACRSVPEIVAGPATLTDVVALRLTVLPKFAPRLKVVLPPVNCSVPACSNNWIPGPSTMPAKVDVPVRVSVVPGSIFTVVPAPSMNLPSYERFVSTRADAPLDNDQVATEMAAPGP